MRICSDANDDGDNDRYSIRFSPIFPLFSVGGGWIPRPSAGLISNCMKGNITTWEVSNIHEEW